MNLLKNFVFKLLIISLSCSAWAEDSSSAPEFFTPRASANIDSTTGKRALLATISRDDLVSHLRNFIDATRPNRTLGTSGHRRSQDYLKEQLKKRLFNADLLVQKFKLEDEDLKMIGQYYRTQFEQEIQAFYSEEDEIYQKAHALLQQRKSWGRQLKASEVTFKNFIWHQKASIESDNDQEQVRESLPPLLLLSFYDSLAVEDGRLQLEESSQAQGADRNATAVIALLMMTEVLSHFHFHRDIYLVFADMGEFASFGVTKVLQKEELKKADVIELLMLGDHPRRGAASFHIYPVNESSHDFAKKVADLSSLARSGLRFELTKAPLLEFSQLSKHSLPDGDSIVLTQNMTQGGNPRAMTSNDFVETLNLNAFHSAFRSLMMVVFSLAQLSVAE